MLGRPAVADYQARPVGAQPGGPEAFQPLKGQAVLGGAGDQVPLDTGPAQFEDCLQARGDPADVPPPAVQCGGQAVAAAAVGEPGAADLPVVTTGIDELGQGELVQS